MSSRPHNQPASAGRASQARVFRPERTHFIAIAFFLVVAVMIMAWAPQYLFWLLIFPVLAAWWVLRARTTVGEDGIAIRYAFRGNRSIPWKDVDGVGFQRARAFVATKKGIKFTLPGVSFNSLPEVAAASRGRVPDALTAGKEAADEKVVVIHRDGQQVLMSKDEFAAYQGSQESSHDGRN